MAKQVINVGSAPNDATGDPLRTAFTKSNDNFTELYAGDLSPPQGRLTLATGTPVMTTTVAGGSSTIYYTPYVGNKIPIYDGASWTMTTFAELSCVNTDTTKNPAAISASKVNDWFVWNDAGTLRLSHGPDWTSDVARSSGTALTRVNGILLNSVAITNGPGALRGTYVGATRSGGAAVFVWQYGAISSGGTISWFGVWNCYNRVLVSSLTANSDDTWTAGATYAEHSANMRHFFVCGLAEDAFRFDGNFMATASASSYGSIALTFDSTTTPIGTTFWVPPNGSQQGPAIYSTTALGWHFVGCIEASPGGGTLTVVGDTGVPQIFQTGIWFHGMM